MEVKVCLKCNEEKFLDGFYKSSGGKYGRHGDCKVCMLSWQKTYHESIKDKRKMRSAEYHKKNKLKISEQSKIRRQLTKDRDSVKKKEYYIKSKNKILVRSNEYKKNRLKVDPVYRSKVYIRNRIRNYFKQKGIRKNKKTEELLGVSFLVAKLHIEKQFTKGMTWENQGKWHIDHIIPLSSAKTEEELIVLCHYTNLQPLWAIDNMIKSDKILSVQVKLTI